MSENSADRDGPDSPTGVRPAADSARLTVDDLLASPRGRSLVLNLVTDPTDDEWEDMTPLAQFGEAMIFAAYVLDKKRKIGSAVYGGDDSEMRRRNVQPAEVAEALRRLDPVAPTQADLEDAMAAVVGGAMYWQPPHSEDVLAHDPEMIEALRAWAEAIIDSGLLDSWSAGPDFDDQWELTWDDPINRDVARRVLEADPADLLGPVRGGAMPQVRGYVTTSLNEWHNEARAEEDSSRRGYLARPFEVVYGEWWSTPPDDLWTTTGTWPSGEPIGLALVEDDYGLERARARRVRMRDTYGVFIVDRPEQWAVLCRKYPLDVTAQRREVWFEATGRRGRWVIPDWSRVAEDYDGVYVSLAGYLRTAGAVVDVGDGSLLPDTGDRPTRGDTDDRIASLMAGWNPDTTYWLTDAVAGITEVVDWAQDDETGAWVAQPRPSRP